MPLPCSPYANRGPSQYTNRPTRDHARFHRATGQPHIRRFRWKSGPWHIVISMSREVEGFLVSDRAVHSCSVIFFFYSQGNAARLFITRSIASACVHGTSWPRQAPRLVLTSWFHSKANITLSFPLGVLSVLPVLFCSKQDDSQFPCASLDGIDRGLCVFFLFGCRASELSQLPGVCSRLFPIFGTWTWCNLGFAVLATSARLCLTGEVGALYFTLIQPCPFVAGAFSPWLLVMYRLILVLPIFLYLWFTIPDGNEPIR